MKRILANTGVILLIATIATIAGFVSGAVSGDWQWFQRSGGAVTLCGAVLASRKLIRQGVKGVYSDERTISGGHFIPTPEDLEKDKQHKEDVRATRWGLILLLAGSLIAIVGDLTGRIIAWISALFADHTQ